LRFHNPDGSGKDWTGIAYPDRLAARLVA